MLPTIAWRGRSVIMIDQRKLPGQETYVRCHTYIQVAQAIEKMVIRGAPAIGIAAAYGLVLGALALSAETARSLDRDFEKVYQRLERTRPTARNLFWALERMKTAYERSRQHGLRAIRTALLAEAKAIEREDAETNRAIGRHGQALIRDGWTVADFDVELGTGNSLSFVQVNPQRVQQSSQLVVAALEVADGVDRHGAGQCRTPGTASRKRGISARNCAPSSLRMP